MLNRRTLQAWQDLELLESRKLLSTVYDLRAMPLAALDSYSVRAPIAISESGVVAFMLAGKADKHTKDTIATWNPSTALDPHVYPGEFHADSLAFDPDGALVALGSTPDYSDIRVARFFAPQGDTPTRDVLFENRRPSQVVLASGWDGAPGHYKISIRWADDGWIDRTSISAKNVVLKSTSSTIALNLVSVSDLFKPGGNASVILATYDATIPLDQFSHPDASYNVVTGDSPVEDVAGNEHSSQFIQNVAGALDTWHTPNQTIVDRAAPTAQIVGVPIDPGQGLATAYGSVVIVGDHLVIKDDQPTRVRVIAGATNSHQQYLEVSDSDVPANIGMVVAPGGSVWYRKPSAQTSEPTLLISAAQVTEGISQLPAPQPLLAGVDSMGWDPRAISPDGATALTYLTGQTSVSYGGGQKRVVVPIRASSPETGFDNTAHWSFASANMLLTDHGSDYLDRVLITDYSAFGPQIMIARVSSLRGQREDGDGASASIPEVVIAKDAQPTGAAHPISSYLASAISKAEHVAAVVTLTDGTVTIVRARAVGQRPVLFVPGIFGSMPGTNEGFKYFLTHMGLPAEQIEIDPLVGTYDDLISSMVNHGYSLNHDLFLVGYDWRLPIAPQAEFGSIDPVTTGLAFNRTFDGVIQGLTAASLTAGNYAYGVDYLGHYLQQAALQFSSDHNNFPLDTVDIIAHSMGGLVARAYIQSTAYGGTVGNLRLPKVNQFIMIATPQRGASKSWNLMHDNFIADPVYQLFLSKMANYAYQRVMNEGLIMYRADGVVISREVVVNLATTSPRYSDTYSSYIESVKYESAFVDLYAPSARALYPTYGFLNTPLGENPVPGTNSRWTINGDPYLRNEILLDLNNGFDLNAFSPDPAPFIKLVKSATMIYGAKKKPDGFGGLMDDYDTLSSTTFHISDDGLPFSDDSFGKIVTMGKYRSRAPMHGEVWYSESKAPGDQTVPEESATGLFDYAPITLFGFHNPGGSPLRSTEHGGLNYNLGVQNLVIKLLGRPVNQEVLSWDKHGVLDPDLLGDGLTLTWDSVFPLATDSQGRRTGVTSSGSFNEIPGARFLGADAGAMVVPGDPSTLRLLTSTGGSLKLNVSATHAGLEYRMHVRAIDAFTEEITFVPVTLDTIALPSSAASPALGPGNSSVIAAVGRTGTLLVFQRATPDASWTALQLELLANERLRGDPISWMDPVSREARVAVVTSSGLVVFSRSGSAWTRRLLPEWVAVPDEGGLGGFNPKVVLNGDVALIQGLNGDTQLVAIGDSGGTLLLYTLAQTAAEWRVENLTVEHLEAQDLEGPTFVSRLATYVTPWDGRNIAGIDSAGNVQSVWWSPGLPRWTTSNLSQITGAPAMNGDITAFTMPWGAVNIVGLNDDGQLLTTWWIPSFGGAWQVANLTSAMSGPTLRSGSLASYVTPWNAQNIAGISDSGETVVYWWAPEGGPDWKVSSLTAVVTGADVHAAFRLRGIAGLSGNDPSLGLTGVSDDGDVTDLFWTPKAGWTLTNVSTVASPA